MLAIKLKRIGKKHQASFRVVIGEKRSKVLGRFLEDVGWFNPRTNELQVNKERALYWMKSGAQPTDTVYNLLVRVGAIKGKKRAVHSISKKKVEEKQAVPRLAMEKKIPEAIYSEEKSIE